MDQESVRPTILVTTPTGRIGGRVLERLTESNVSARAIVRNDAARTRVASHELVDVVVAPLIDEESLNAASAGADGLFLALPVDYSVPDLIALWRQIAAAAASAIRQNDIRHVVFLSSQGARENAGSLIGPLYEAEQAILSAAPNVRVLRAGCFMENLLPYASQIAEGTMPFPMASDAPVRMIATRDIGDLAARFLADLSWTGHSARGVYGPEDLTPRSAAEIIQGVLGRNVELLRVTPADIFREMTDEGVNTKTADLIAGMFAIMGAPEANALDPRSAEGTTHTTLRAFVEESMVPLIRE